jgi:hypothetical protein
MLKQSKLNQSNFNIATINNNYQSLDTQSNITINNSIKITKSAFQTNSASDNSNAAILLKDVNSSGQGAFYPLKVDSSEYGSPYLYFNSNIIIDGSNLLSELEEILNYYPLETSNIIVKGGYINFWNGSIPNSNVGHDGVGLRYSGNNTVQFKNYNTDWIDLADITKHDQFSELIDVDVHTNPLLNNQYITYNATSNLFVNSNLAIVNDINPTLGGNLAIGENSLFFGTDPTNLYYRNPIGGITNPLIQLDNNTTLTGVANYLQLANADNGDNPAISAIGISSHIGIDVNTKGSGDITLNATSGNIYNNADSLVISGYVRNSIYRTSTKPGGYIPETTWNIPLTNDCILFDFRSNTAAGTYWANVSAGIDGQKLNLIFNNKSSNVVSVLADFGTNGLLVGTGANNGLRFETTGQSTSLVYLGDGIDAWQVLNTGSGVF